MDKESVIEILENLIEDIRNGRISTFEYRKTVEPVNRFFTGMLDMDSCKEETTLIFNSRMTYHA